MPFAIFLLNSQNNCCVLRPANPFRIKYTWLKKTNITFILEAYQIIKKQTTVNTIENFTKPTISLNFIFLQR